jgi:hypothetical protein
VDGVKMTSDQMAGNSPGGLPQSMIDQITTITGGIPAKYGDATGGIVEINTLNAAPKFFGSVQGITSEGLDHFGYNDVNFSVGGPIWSKKDTATNTKTPILDFILGGEYIHQKDDDPTFVGGYTVNQDTLSKIAQHPFVINPAGGFQRSAEYITADQISHSPTMPNTPSDNVSLNGKLGLHISNNVSIVLGGSYQYTNQKDFEYVYELFNSQENPQEVDNAWRAFARVTQRFASDKNSLIQNAFYTLQGEYGKSNQVIENSQFGNNWFDYGYIGKFYQNYAPVYSFNNAGPQGPGYYMTAYRDSLLNFTPSSTINPLEANYTSQLYQLLGTQNVNNGYQLEENQGLLNGDRPGNVYSLWYNTGRAYPGYSESDNSHFRFSANFSADIKSNAVQVGFEYEQNIVSYYDVNAAGLWTAMRQNSNLQLQQLDLSNPIQVGSGLYNTYNYNYAYNASQQTQIDKSIREKLGMSVSSTTYIQPDNLDPSFFNINMFSASDLLNNGSSYVSYYGYDYMGNKSNSNPSINDFFDQRDANGNLTYPIAPYHPIYIAGYIQDHFDIKNMKFDVGVRIDRFDANQPVLSDPYTLSPIRTVSEVGNSLGEIPANMGSNYAVYVNSIQNPTTIVGYRNGNTWYNASGNVVNDPTVLASSTTTGTIQPYLVNQNQSSVAANAFTNYTPQVNVMPRIAFAFPISDMANFFAHYDVLTMRPPGIGYNLFIPTQYLFINSYISSILNNPNLQPQQTTEYELGYTQVLDERRTSALTFSAFYRENRNEVQTYRYLEAYPTSYLAYSNIDFGTTKGLSIAYDLRRTNNIKFRASYTLQFANGTGSSPTSGYNLANSGEPNLQIPQPLDNDQRHTFLFNIDYHYGSGDNYNGPVWTTKGGKAIQLLSNAGLNLNFNAGSGTPYTVQSNATEGNGSSDNVGIGIAQHYGLVGSVNGAYLPWQYRLDLRVDKEFPITINPSKGDKARHCNLLVYFAITNLLNTQNVIQVYHYTGSPSDDGYLASSQGQQAIPQQTDPQAFLDQYKIKEQDPTFLALPREIHLGVEFDF